MVISMSLNYYINYYIVKADIVNDNKKNQFVKDTQQNLESIEQKIRNYINPKEEKIPIEEKKHVITHICFDDLIGSKEVFKKSRDGGLVKFLLKHRHLYTNVFITTQYINAISPIIKNNIDIIGREHSQLFRTFNPYIQKLLFKFVML
jgi:hypothetical protein